MRNKATELILLCTVVLASRIPFLWAGFGAEEDSWLLALTAKNISVSGVYEMSRAPAHPLQELIYSWMYTDGLFAFSTNLLSAIASAIAVLFFALSLKNIGFKHYVFAAYAFAFTPVVFISSTYTIDYMLAMAFVMGSFYCVSSPLSPGRGAGGEVLAGLLLGLATGFRLTSLSMLIPLCLLLMQTTSAFSLSKESLKRIFIFSFTALAIACIAYIPVIKTYGLTFFTYADQFPYPNLPKVFYKATVGVFGTVGLLLIVTLKCKILWEKFFKKENLIPAALQKNLFYASVAVILLCFISYLRLPQKSAYLIPLVPFVILLFGYYLSGRAFKIFCTLLTLSSFLFSMNLTDPIRGSGHSPAGIKFTTAGQEVFIDPLTGPVFSDYTKRLNKLAYTKQVREKLQNEKRKIVLIAGWWHNQLSVELWKKGEERNTLSPNGHLNFILPGLVLAYYIDQPAMEKFISEGYELFYLPEQDLYNDQYSGMAFTASVARPYM